jgi:hypothetical protein
MRVRYSYNTEEMEMLVEEGDGLKIDMSLNGSRRDIGVIELSNTASHCITRSCLGYSTDIMTTLQIPLMFHADPCR